MPIDVYPKSEYPPYCSGRGYLISRESVIRIVEALEEEDFHQMLVQFSIAEDALFTGDCLICW